MQGLYAVYKKEVQEATFPAEAHSFRMPAEALEQLMKDQK